MGGSDEQPARVWFIVFVTLLNFVTYSTWTLWNKLQFKHEGAGLSVLLTAYQMLFAGGMSWVGISAGFIPRKSLSRSTLVQNIVPLGLCRSADIGFGNAALAMVSVALQQIVKSTIPVYVCILTVLVLRRPVRLRTWLALIPVVGGTLVAAAGEVSATASGLTLAILSCVARAGKKIINDILLHGVGSQERFSAAQIIAYESPLSGLLLLSIGLVLEGDVLTDRVVGEAGVQTTELPSGQANSLTKLLATNSAISCLMFLNQWSYMNIIDTTSAMTCGILMNVKMVTLISVSVLIFGSSLGLFNWCGIAVAVAGAAWYGHEQARAKVEEAQRQSQAAADEDVSETELGQLVLGKQASPLSTRVGAAQVHVEDGGAMSPA